MFVVHTKILCFYCNQVRPFQEGYSMTSSMNLSEEQCPVKMCTWHSPGAILFASCIVLFLHKQYL